jgi:hypothetical protein
MGSQGRTETRTLTVTGDGSYTIGSLSPKINLQTQLARAVSDANNRALLILNTMVDDFAGRP